ncbi:hypothetical protein JOE63_002590 [Cellulosimicrobium cellulans]|uniref:hypothetical protein n=1 Tax=Cellulosimicrobium cellulans TaxID=1710 RepID=UPI00195AEEE2|nr:hypothetical protein [Cellulosimicrobium cellulans]MBM7820113.1 hypothetical protein [Cellulosimicrobium cellulans]
MAWLLNTIEHTSLSDVLEFATTWTAKSGATDVRWSDVDREFAQTYLSGEYLDRALVFLAKPRRRLVVPQALMVLIKIALFSCGRQVRTPEHVRLLPAALFTVGSGLNGGKQPRRREDLIGEFIANQHFNNSTDPATSMALYDARWHDGRFSDGQLPLAQTYAEVMGHNLNDLALVVLAIWARVNLGGSPFFRTDMFSGAIDPQATEQVLSLLSATPEQLRQQIDEAEIAPSTPWNSVPWTFSAFERFPLIQHDDSWFVVSPKFLLDRLVTWLPVFDVKAAIEAQGSASDAARFDTRFRTTTERYVQDIVARTYELLPGRVYTEVELRAELGRNHKVADIAIDYGHAWVVADVSTRRLMREAAHGGAGVTLDHEIDALCKKFEQIHSTIRRIREARFQVRPSRGESEPARFYPVLILTEGYPVNPFVLDRLREVLAAKNILCGRDTAAPEVIDLADLEAVESLATSGGPTLIDVIRSKQNGPLRNMDMTSHIRNALGLSPTRPERVKQAQDRVFGRVVAALPPQDASIETPTAD